MIDQACFIYPGTMEFLVVTVNEKTEFYATVYEKILLKKVNDFFLSCVSRPAFKSRK